MNELLTLSGLELAKRISKKQVSPTEVVEAHIERIEQVNPSLNAMVENNFVRARLLAHQQTEQVAKSSSALPTYFGVPFTIKEMIAVEGMKRTGGSIHYKDNVMDQDATIVTRMKNAGGIPLGTTNVPELGFWLESFNPVYGRTNNPYDLTRTCGGSSGGEGALIGAGASPIGLGSDMGGSIRMPAFFCGIFGHIPSRGLLPITGHFPYVMDTTDYDPTKPYFASTGPMSRRAEDLYMMVKILKGPDDQDRTMLPDFPLPERTEVWAGRKIWICPSPAFHLAGETSAELQQVVRNCGRLFEELGAEIQEIDPRFFVRATELWFAALKESNLFRFSETLFNKKSVSIQKEIFNILTGRRQYTLPTLLVAAGEMLNLGEKDLAEAIQALAQMKMDLDKMLGEEGILLLPPYPRVAPKHRAPLLSPFDFIYTGIFTMTGNPATVAPMGLNSQGLPLGIQIVARHLNDHITLSCAEFLETTFGGWQPPKVFGS